MDNRELERALVLLADKVDLTMLRLKEIEDKLRGSEKKSDGPS